MKRLRRGFSLLEVILVLFLTGMVLGCVALLTRETLGTLKFLQEKSETLQSATLGLERLASELSEAVGAPSSVTVGNPVRFFKVRPSEPRACGNDPDDPLDPTDSFDPPATWVRVYANPVQVTYSESGGTMTRSAAGITTVVASKVDDFQVSTFGGRTDVFSIVLTIKENRRLVTFRTNSVAPGLSR